MLRTRGELWLGLGTVAFALLLLLVLIPQGITVPKSVKRLVLSPTFWPNIIGCFILAMGAVLTLQAIVAPRPPAEAEDRPRAPRSIPGTGRVLAFVGILAGYFLLIAPLGMVPASILAMLAYLLLVRARRRLAGIAVAIALPLVLDWFFLHVAGVPMPSGWLVSFP